MIRWSVGSIALLLSLPADAASQGALRGKLTITDKGGKPARDVADAVVWVDAPGATRAGLVEVATERKAFTPSVVVVAAGGTVAFPNHDPFNHNVFSVSEEAPFDLGLYGRGETRTARFLKPGVVRVYCNIHGQMGAAVVVVATPHVARPGADGGFVLEGLPRGRHTVTVWHERGGTTQREVEVGADGAAEVALALDASGYRPRPHLNKFGKPYETQGRRY